MVRLVVRRPKYSTGPEAPPQLAVRGTQVQGRYLLRAFVWVNQLEAAAQRLTLKDCVDDAGDVASLP